MTHENGNNGHERDGSLPLDHDAICRIVAALFVNGHGTVHEAVDNSWERQADADELICESFASLGRHFIPLDEVGVMSSDTTGQRVFVSGAAVALEMLDAAAAATHLDADKFRQDWLQTGFVRVIDTTDPRYHGWSDQDKYRHVANGIEAVGQRELDDIPDAYGDFIDYVASQYDELGNASGLFKVAFGYVFGSGLRTIAKQYGSAKHTRNVVVHKANQAAASLLPIGYPRPVDYDSVTDAIDTKLFFSDGDTTAAAYLSESIECMMAVDRESIDVAQKLSSIVCYDEKDRSTESNEVDEAFFYGITLGFDVHLKLAEAQSIAPKTFLRLWRQIKGHRMLMELSHLSEQQCDLLRAKVASELNQAIVGQEYVFLADKVASEVCDSKELEEVMLQGARYGFATSHKVFEKIRYQQVERYIKTQVNNLDAELAALLRDSAE